MTGWSLSGTVRLRGEVLFRGEIALSPGWTCLMGPSGAGKTTLLRLLAGLPVAAELEGRVLRPGRVGWVAQDDLLQPRQSVGANVALLERLAGRAVDPARVERLLAQVGLAGFAARRPVTLSGGQRQRVALARMLMQQAEVVAMDEPFSALDPATRRQMQDLARGVLRGRTVLMVTHDPTEALRMADRVLVLAGGTLAEVPLPGAPPRDPEAGGAAGALLRLVRAVS